MSRMLAPLMAASCAALLATSPAAASVVFGGVGDTVTLGYNGFTTPDGSGGIIDGLTALQTITLTGVTGSTFTFTYTLENNSSAPITSSRVSIFGFTSTPDIVSASTSGEFSKVVLPDDPNGGNVPNLTFDAEACITDKNTCSGGGGGGVVLGDTGTGTFTLTYAPGTTSVVLDDFFVRYQSLNTREVPEGSATGMGTAVPEPATWAFMIFGFGAIGVSMRLGRRPLTAKYSSV